MKQGFTSNDLRSLLHFKVLLSYWTSAFGQDGVTESSGCLSSPDSTRTSGFHEMIQEAVTGSLEEWETIKESLLSVRAVGMCQTMAWESPR